MEKLYPKDTENGGIPEGSAGGGRREAYSAVKKATRAAAQKGWPRRRGALGCTAVRAAGRRDVRMDSKLEWERFKTEIDLRVFAAAQNYQIDRKESWAGSAVMRHPNGDKIAITKDTDGHFVFYSFRDDAGGSILDFAKYRLGLSISAAQKELRSFMELPPPLLAPYPPLQRVAKDRIRVARAYARMRIALTHPYLERERCIPRQVLESRRFADRIRIDSPHGNAVFGHFDGDGLCGFEIKNRGFTGFSTGGTKGLFMSHVQNQDNRIVFCESAVDALSYAALFPDAQTRYASLGGRPSPAQRDLIRAAGAVMPPSSTVISAMDSDTAGREIGEIVREAVRLTGRSDLRFEIVEPQEVKDWNDALRSRRVLHGAEPI
jgi:hypothetical protein